MDQKTKPLTAIVIGETFTPSTELALDIAQTHNANALQAPALVA